MTQEDYHQKVMECIQADDLQAALDYIEEAEHKQLDMCFEREQFDLAVAATDATLAREDEDANELYDRLKENDELL